MESKLRDMYIKETLVYISENFNDDIKHNINLLVNYVIPYVNSIDFNIDEAIQLLEKCPKLIETIREFRKSNNKFNRESALLNAFYLITKNDIDLKVLEPDEFDNIDDFDDSEDFVDSIYYKQKEYCKKDVDLVKMFLKDISIYPRLSKEEIRDLFIKYNTSTGEDKYLVREEIINHNLRLVAGIAKRYIGKGVEYLDLINQGSIGLIKAVEKYNYKLGYTFSTYATWWIKQYISRYIDEYSKPIRIPSHYALELNKYDRHYKIMTMELGRYPEREEMAKELNVSVEKIIEYEKRLQTPIYLEMPINGEDGKDDLTFGDLINDKNDDIDNIADNLLLENFIDIVKNDTSLKDKERDILFLRYGIYDGIPQTLQQVADKYHVTRERIRQIEVRAIGKIRKKYKKYKQFGEYFNDSVSLKLKNH